MLTWCLCRLTNTWFTKWLYGMGERWRTCLWSLKSIYFRFAGPVPASHAPPVFIYSLPTFTWPFLQVLTPREEPSKSSFERCLHKKVMNSLLSCKSAEQHHICGLMRVVMLLIVLPVQFKWNVKWFLQTLSGASKV